jgi:4-hydroxy-4-methyl-2-oxoglutarate aldolase
MSAPAAVSSQLLEQAAAFGSATVYEASKIDCMVDPAIRPVWLGASIAAPAYPLQCSPNDNLAIHIAVERAPKGSILVVDALGFIAGYWGEVLTVAAEAAGLAGLVIDGGVRDTAAITAHRFPVFTRGISVRGTIKASAPSVSMPIRLGGCPVSAGDIVVADDDGVIVVPAAHFEQTMKNAAERVAKETQMMQRLRAGETTLEQLGLTHWRKAVP